MDGILLAENVKNRAEITSEFNICILGIINPYIYPIYIYIFFLHQNIENLSGFY